jgi:hypothetical protein
MLDQQFVAAINHCLTMSLYIKLKNGSRVVQGKSDDREHDALLPLPGPDSGMSAKLQVGQYQ